MWNQCVHSRLRRVSILFGVTVTCLYLIWRTCTPPLFWNPTKLTRAYDMLYESLNLTRKNSNCWKILSGDPEAVSIARLKPITTGKKHKVFSEIDYLSMTRDCDHFAKSRKYITFTLSPQERDFPLAYSMVIHTNIEMFERLLRSIYAPQNVYCVHVDKKSTTLFRLAVHSIAFCFSNVFIVSKLESVIYASWSRVQADLNCMEELLRSPVPWKYLINVCGQDFPMKTNLEIVNNLMAMNGSNVMDSVPPQTNKKKRWEYKYETRKTVVATDRKKKPPPIRSPIFVGGAYIHVTRQFVRTLFVNSKIQAFFNWSKDTYSPDEHVWATLQRMSEVPGSSPYVPRQHRNDNPVVTRVVKWSSDAGDIEKGASYSHCKGKYRHEVCVYASADLQWIVQQEPMFANKFDPGVDNLAVECMEEYVRYKSIQRIAG